MHALGVQPQQTRGELVDRPLLGRGAVAAIVAVAVTTVATGAGVVPDGSSDAVGAAPDPDGPDDVVVPELPYVSGELRRPAFPSS